MSIKIDYKEQLARAVRIFWSTREEQGRRQGAKTSTRDTGYRNEATGGKQMDGFADLVRVILRNAGVPDASVSITKRMTNLPGFYRPTKQWDLVVVHEDKLIASIELNLI